MDALRSRRSIRIAPVMEWLLAAGLLSCVIAAAALMLRELRAAPLPPLSAPVARMLSSSVPAVIPPLAVSVPALPFQDGKEVRVGDSVAAVANALGRSAEVGRQEVDRGGLGERLTRFY